MFIVNIMSRCYTHVHTPQAHFISLVFLRKGRNKAKNAENILHVQNRSER